MNVKDMVRFCGIPLGTTKGWLFREVSDECDDSQLQGARRIDGRCGAARSGPSDGRRLRWEQKDVWSCGGAEALVCTSDLLTMPFFIL